jgi:hypothetical protein
LSVSKSDGLTNADPGDAVTYTISISNSGPSGVTGGTETQRKERDWLANATVLSGDIAGDDTSDANGVVTDTDNISGTNSYHVVSGSGVSITAVLDGFTITAGQANGSYSALCDPKCGGGVYNINGSPTLVNMVFSGNSADYGGGMYNRESSSPALTDVEFSGNSAEYNGGGMYNDNSSPTLTNVVFSENLVESGGGGIYNTKSSSPALTDVAFSGNSANFGGGMYNKDESSPALTNVVFSGNSAGYYGGGMVNWESSPALTNVVFSGNSAKNNGGGMHNYNSSPALTNVEFSGNSAADEGGGMRNENGSSPDVRNSILWNNRDNDGTGTIKATVTNVSGSTITLTHSLAQGVGASGGSWTADASYLDGGNNIDEDPLFITDVNPSSAPTSTGNLRLQFGSPSINAGEDTYVSVLIDLDGELRISGGTVDMGAYETQIHETPSAYFPLVYR